MTLLQRLRESPTSWVRTGTRSERETATEPRFIISKYLKCDLNWTCIELSMFCRWWLALSPSPSDLQNVWEFIQHVPTVWQSMLLGLMERISVHEFSSHGWKFETLNNLFWLNFKAQSSTYGLVPFLIIISHMLNQNVEAVWSEVKKQIFVSNCR